MMKIEIEKDFPQYFKPAYPEEFELFSHFEVTAGIPTVLFAVTTWKENGKPKARRLQRMSDKQLKSNMSSVPIWKKMNLTVEEASEYSGIGTSKIKELSNCEDCPPV